MSAVFPTPGSAARLESPASRAEQSRMTSQVSSPMTLLLIHSRWSFPPWQELCTFYSWLICRPLQTPKSFSVFPTYSPPPDLSALLHTLLHCISAWGFQKHLLSFSNHFLFQLCPPEFLWSLPGPMSSANFTSSPSYKSLIKTENSFESKTGPFGTLTWKALPDLQANNESHYLKQISQIAICASYT